MCFSHLTLKLSFLLLNVSFCHIFCISPNTVYYPCTQIHIFIISVLFFLLLILFYYRLLSLRFILFFDHLFRQDIHFKLHSRFANLSQINLMGLACLMVCFYCSIINIILKHSAFQCYSIAIGQGVLFSSFIFFSSMFKERTFYFALLYQHLQVGSAFEPAKKLLLLNTRFCCDFASYTTWKTVF